ncbi:MAG: response regulator [Planctomycetaceae bacterium]|nr:response regulator [Planctomycetaceae bacterium]
MPKILLVDDEEPNRDFLSRRLVKRGYVVVEAVNGVDACAKADSERPDIILMDVNMPVLDGLQATQQIRSNPDIRQIPIIALTALAMAGDRERLLAAGCDDYESKPIELPQLLTKIQTLLDARSAT